MLYVANAPLGRHVTYDTEATRRAAATYAGGEMQESLLLGWSPWDGTLPGRPDVVGMYRPASIAGLTERLVTHGFVLEPMGLRGMSIKLDRAGMLARLRTGRMRAEHGQAGVTS